MRAVCFARLGLLLGGGALVDVDVYDISVAKAIAIGIGVLVGGWLCLRSVDAVAAGQE